jgi:succinate dehydrogenase/fumarate reductase flavoprotein subunit
METEVIDAKNVSDFDESVDVLVVGLGAAGAAATLEAAASGAETLVIERAGGGGGTSAMSGGVLYLGGGTKLQKACGFEDSEQAMYDYMMASVGRGLDEEKIRHYCEGSVAHFDWLLEQGVPFKQTFYPGISGEPPTDDGLVFSGSEWTHPYRDIAAPAPRGHVPQIEFQGGPKLMQKLCEAVDGSSARLAANTLCTALYQESDGTVVGARLDPFGQTRTVRARGGVVITTGGFVLNNEMLDVHAPDARRCKMRVAADGDDGSGIRLGMEAGAATRHMDALSISMPVTQPWGLKRGLLVNAQGQRFVNEDTYYGTLGHEALLKQDGKAWLIVDDEIYEKPDYDPRELVGVGETPEELEREVGLPEGSLQATLSLYNRHAEKGRDPVFHKGEEYVQPLRTPPFGALDCNVESSLYAVFTLGGLASDPDGRILDPENRPVVGLYGAGRSTSGLAIGGYSSGMSLGDGTFFGRRAGRSAAIRARQD